MLLIPVLLAGGWLLIRETVNKTPGSATSSIYAPQEHAFPSAFRTEPLEC